MPFNTTDITFIGQLVPTKLIDIGYENAQPVVPLNSTNVKEITIIDNIFAPPILYIDADLRVDQLIRLDYTLLSANGMSIVIEELSKHNHTMLMNAVYKVIEYKIKARDRVEFYAIPLAAYNMLSRPMPQQKYDTIKAMLFDIASLTGSVFDDTKSTTFLQSANIALFSDGVHTVAQHNETIYTYLLRLLFVIGRSDSQVASPIAVIRFNNNKFYVEFVDYAKPYVGQLLVQSHAAYKYNASTEFTESILNYDLTVKTVRPAAQAAKLDLAAQNQTMLDFTNVQSLGKYATSDTHNPITFTASTTFSDEALLYALDIESAIIQVDASIQGNFLLQANRSYYVSLNEYIANANPYNVSLFDGKYYATQLIHRILFDTVDNKYKGTISTSIMKLIKNAYQYSLSDNINKTNRPVVRQ